MCIGTTFVITQGEEKKALILLVKSDGNGVLGGGILLSRCDTKNRCLHRWWNGGGPRRDAAGLEGKSVGSLKNKLVLLVLDHTPPRTSHTAFLHLLLWFPS